MTATVGVSTSAPGAPPVVTLKCDDVAVTISWAEWQELVHRASWLYVRWCARAGLDLDAESDRLAHGALANARAAGRGEH